MVYFQYSTPIKPISPSDDDVAWATRLNFFLWQQGILNPLVLLIWWLHSDTGNLVVLKERNTQPMHYCSTGL
jgi:hypothetical protein